MTNFGKWKEDVEVETLVDLVVWIGPYVRCPLLKYLGICEYSECQCDMYNDVFNCEGAIRNWAEGEVK